MSLPANETRGEIPVALGGKEYVLRPSFEAIKAFEGKSGKGLLQLVAAAGDMSIQSNTAAIIVTECIRAQGRAVGDEMMANVDVERIGELIQEAGLLLIVKRLELLLFLAATGGVTASGEMKATPKSQTGTPGAAKRGSRQPR